MLTSNRSVIQWHYTPILSFLFLISSISIMAMEQIKVKPVNDTQTLTVLFGIAHSHQLVIAFISPQDCSSESLSYNVTLSKDMPAHERCLDLFNAINTQYKGLISHNSIQSIRILFYDNSEVKEHCVPIKDNQSFVQQYLQLTGKNGILFRLMQLNNADIKLEANSTTYFRMNIVYTHLEKGINIAGILLCGALILYSGYKYHQYKKSDDIPNRHH